MSTAELTKLYYEHDLSGAVPVPRRTWRNDDPPATTIGDLSPDDFGKRIVIRSKEFLGTVYGTLVGIAPHPSLRKFTTVQLYGKKELTFRSDTETLVVN